MTRTARWSYTVVVVLAGHAERMRRLTPKRCRGQLLHQRRPRGRTQGQQRLSQLHISTWSSMRSTSSQQQPFGATCADVGVSKAGIIHGPWTSSGGPRACAARARAAGAAGFGCRHLQTSAQSSTAGEVGRRHGCGVRKCLVFKSAASFGRPSGNFGSKISSFSLNNLRR